MRSLWFLSVLGIISCASPVMNRNPVGEAFPVVQGESLDGKKWTLPSDLKGKSHVLLIGYVQETQFDIDRWLIGFEQYGLKLGVLEVPTIKGWVPRLISSKIDSGMRSGIPEELWKIVITVYGDSDKIIGMTGNENPRNARVVLLGDDGKVLFMEDRGFSVGGLKKLLALVPNDKKSKCPCAK